MNPKHWFSRLFMALGVLFILSPASLAQIVSGSIVGTVQDETGAVLPDVAITITNVGTQLTRTTVTDGAGNYVVAQLPPGTYMVTAKRSGFKSVTSSNVMLEVEQKVRVNFTLIVGGIEEVVTVEAPGAALDTETPSLGQVIDEKRVVDLPLNGRNFLQLATLAAGSVPILNNRTSTAVSVTGRTGLSVNIAGGRDDSNSFLIDGVESRQPWLGTVSILPSVDAIQEFKVQRSLFSAEYGQGTGIVNIAIKSGSNSWHGTAYEFLRNDKLDARNFFDSGDPPPFKQNQFGFTIGGPILRNRTFFFGNYEGLRTRRANTLIGNFPSRQHLSGDFSDLPAGSIIDPVTRQPFPNNRIPEERMSQVARRYRAFIPAPNRNVPGANYITAPSQVNDFDQFNIRVDQRLGARDNGFARYTFYDSLLTIPGLAPLYGVRNPLSGQSLALQETHIFGPRAVNVFKFGYNRGRVFNMIENSETDIGTDLGFRNLNNRPQDFGLPTMRIIGFSTTGQFFLNQGSTSNLFQLSDTLSLTLGGHTLNTGADIRIHQFQVSSTLFRQGLSIFAPVFTRNAVADFLLGLPAVILYQHGAGGGNLRSQSYNFFVQDDWKVAPKLTLNLGLRYEYDTPWTEIDDRQGFFDTSVPGGQIRLIRDPKTFGFQATSPLLSFGGVRRGIVKPDRNNVAPRFGFAYTPWQDFVIRGGYGIFYAAQSANEFTSSGGLPPFVIAPAIRPGTPLDMLFPNVNSPTYDLTGAGPFTLDPNAPYRPYAQQWNLSLQTTLFKNTVVEASYAGSKGTHLWERVNINNARLPDPSDPNPAASLQSRRPFPNYGDVLRFSFRENSNYNALQLRVDRRFEQGLSFLVSYTFSKSIDTASGGFFTTSHQDRNNLDGERGRSNFDVRHMFILSHTYDLPFGRGKALLGNVTGALDKFISGWQVNGILTFASGQPFGALVDGDNAVIGGFYAPRANRLRDGNLPPGQRTPNRWFDTSAFATPPRGTFGNSGRNILDGPGTKLYDFSLFKNTYVGERVNVQFRTEVFNIFNHPNFLAPLGTGFDKVNAPASFGIITQARNAREIQFGLKVIF